MLSFNDLLVQIEAYKRKFFYNQLIKGLLITLGILLVSYLVFNTLEYFGHFGTSVRAVLFFAFCAILLACGYIWIFKPAFYLLVAKKPINNQEAAIQIGNFFPEIKDKLLNTIQLASAPGIQTSELLQASINQKTKQLGIVRFTDAINVKENKKYAKYAVLPAIVIGAILAVSPSYFAESSKRIVNFKNEFAQPAPFQFVLKNKNLTAFKNEDFTINFTIEGKSIPDAIYLVNNDRKIKLESIDQKNYYYTFRNLQKETTFTFEAAGFSSESYLIKIVNKPSLDKLIITLDYPAYLGKLNTTIENSGNFTVPEGTKVNWSLVASDVDKVTFSFDQSENINIAKGLFSGNYDLSKTITKPINYNIKLNNKYQTDKDGVGYSINVVQDNYPSISMEQYKDTTLYSYLILGGNIGDDYGITNLKVNYKIDRNGSKSGSGGKSFSIPIDRKQTIQSFYTSWPIDSLKLKPGDKLLYEVQVTDNDGFNGPKSSKTTQFTYKIPGKEKLDDAIAASVDKTQEQLDKTMSNAQKLKKEIAALEKRLKNKSELDFQDKKLIEEVLKKREDLMEEVRNLQEQNKISTEQQKRFQDQKPEITQKLEQLDNLIKDLLNEDTKKMYEDLKKLMEKNQNDKMLDQLENLKNKEKNLEKELDRAMKLFKKLEKEQKVNNAIGALKKQAEQQDKLSEKTEQADKKDEEKEKKDEEKANIDEENKDDKALEKEQEELEKAFDKVKEDLKDAEKLSEELKEEEKLDTDKKSQQEISEEQKDSKKNLAEKNKKKAAEKQKKASKKMKALAEKLEEKNKDQETIEMDENIDDLRQILDNLVKLSFDEEKLMKDFRNINVGDPRFVKLGQEQVKLKDDAKIIEDSLYSLAGRVFQIKSFITREVSLMKYHMDESAKAIKERRMGMISGKQQFAMTSMNNLALLLSDVLKNMQLSAAEMGSGKGGKPKKGKNKLPIPNLAKMQEKMNGKMKGIGKGKGEKGEGDGKDGKNGKPSKDGKGGNEGDNGSGAGNGSAEELAKLAYEQGKIRKMLQELLESQKNNMKGNGLSEKVKDLMKKMEESESDIINKNITQQTLRRQEEIQTRLLESEKALKEQEEDDQRKANVASEIPKAIPKQLEEYIKQKQKQTELIRTVPPSFTPFYKKEVDSYFKRVN